LDIRIPFVVGMTAIALIGCGTAGSIFNANDEATIIESRKSVQAWNRDSLAWLKELKSPSVTPEGLKADLAKMKADVANFSVEATKIEDPKLRSLMARLAKAYQGELTGYSKATSEISAGHGEAAANAMDQLFKANDKQQSAATAFLEYVQAKSAASN